jgi:hypothetical protein
MAEQRKYELGEERDGYSEWYGHVSRRTSPEVDFGVWWRDGNESTYRLSWLEATGELYARRQGYGARQDRYILFGTYPSRGAVEQALRGWADTDPMVLDWVRERTCGFPARESSESVRPAERAEAQGKNPSEDVSALEAEAPTVPNITEKITEEIEAAEAMDGRLLEGAVLHTDNPLARQEQVLRLWDGGVRDVAELVRRVKLRPSVVIRTLQRAGHLVDDSRVVPAFYRRFFAGTQRYATVEQALESVARLERLYNYFERLADRAGQHEAMVVALCSFNHARWQGHTAEAQLFWDWLRSKR